MAIPWDPTRHIEGIASGIKDAMPGIQAGIQQAAINQPGDENLQRFINMYWQRREAGEDKESVMNDLLSQFQASATQQTNMPHANSQVHTVGLNQGQPALGPPNGLASPIAQGPNSFAPNISTAQPTQSISQVAQQQPQPVQQPIQSQQAPLPAVNYSVPGPTEPITVSRPDAPMEESTKVSLMRERPMSTATGGKPPPIPSRSEQARQLDTIKQITDLETKTGTLEFKKAKQEQDATVKILTSMARNNRLTAKDKAELEARMVGLDQKGQIAVTKMWLDQKYRDELLKVRWAAHNLRQKLAPLTAKMPPELKLAFDNYQRSASRITQFKGSGMSTSDPVLTERMLIEMENNRNEYNNLAQKLSNATGTQFPLVEITAGPVPMSLPETGGGNEDE